MRSELPILLVDDEPMILRAVSVALMRAGMDNVLAVEDARDVMPVLAGNPVAAVVLDLQMPHISGVELLPGIRKKYPQVPVIILTATAEVETAVECMKVGAFDYLVKPINPARLITTLTRALELRDLRKEVGFLRSRFLDPLEEGTIFEGRFLTVNETVRNVLRYAEAIASGNYPVLICGERGVGKGTLARLVHQASGRSGAFTRVDVGGMDDEEFVSAVFGFRPGALSQAEDANGSGLSSVRSGGTLYLDGLDRVPPASQQRVLELIQTGTYRPVGAETSVRTGVRLMASAGPGLEAAVEEGVFSAELFRELDEHRIVLPALRDRPEDVPLLVSVFLEEGAREFSGRRPHLDAGLLVALLEYRFPGNVGELKTLMRDAVYAEAGGETAARCVRRYLELAGLRTDNGDGGGAPGEGEEKLSEPMKTLFAAFGHFPTVEEATDFLIDEALRLSRGNKRAAAAVLQITRQTINRRLRMRGQTAGS